MTQPGESPLYKELLYSEPQVSARIGEMAVAITEEYDERSLLMVSLLNGAAPFVSKLMFAITEHDPQFHPDVQSMIVSRYGANREPGVTRVVTDLPPDYRDLRGRNVLLLDDLIDGGDTTAFTADLLRERGATNVDLAVLVKKQKERTTPLQPKFFGFEAPDVWLTGMGMDDTRIAAEANRWAGWIAVAND